MPVAMGEARKSRGQRANVGRTNGRVGNAVEWHPRDLSETPAARVGDLSPAERDVVLALAEGLSPKEVALDRGTSLSTVRTQIKRAKKKSTARTLSELVALVCMAERDLAVLEALVPAD